MGRIALLEKDNEKLEIENEELKARLSALELNTKLPSTILYPDTFNRSKPAGFDGVYDWTTVTILNGKSCYDRRVRPMDFDAGVEAGGQHLVEETKDPGVPVPDAQLDSLGHLVNTKTITVVILWGKDEPKEFAAETMSEKAAPALIKYGGVKYGDRIVIELRPMTREEQWHFRRDWFLAVDFGRRTPSGTLLNPHTLMKVKANNEPIAQSVHEAENERVFRVITGERR